VDFLSAEPEGKGEAQALLATLSSQIRDRDRSHDGGKEIDVKFLVALCDRAKKLRYSEKDLAGAEPSIREALELAKLMSEAELARDPAQDALQWCHHNLGDILLQLQNNPAEAADHYRQARAIQESKIAARGINSAFASELGWSCQNGTAALLRLKPDAQLVSVAVRGVEMREYLVAQAQSDGARAALLSTLHMLGQALAWVSDAHSADLEKAAALAEARTQASPGHGVAWRILGIVRYHQEEYAEAVTALESAVAAEMDKPTEPAIDHFFLAMALAKIGRVDEAQRSLNAGREWVSKNRPTHAPFRSLSEQAGAVVESK
jgi:tetratricopeptide (TPR) repeat protein